MNTLELRSISSPDIELYQPVVVTNEEVYFLLQLEVGQKGQREQELFQLVVATPEALLHRADNFVICDRAVLVVREWDWPKVEQEIRNIIDSCRGGDWYESAAKLQRHFRGEYER